MVPMPYPVAWNDEPRPMDIAANTKQKEIVFNAGTPSLYISSVAEKSESKAFGKRLKTRVPNTMIKTAMRVPIFMVAIILSFFLGFSKTLKPKQSFTAKPSLGNGTWTTSNKGVVKISKKKASAVKITAVKPGKATVTFKGNGYTVTDKIVVKKVAKKKK